MPSIKSALSASALAFAFASAHMTLLTPPPYGNPDSSPIDANGANFPCKATSNSGAQVTEMQIGSTQKLSFKGSAVHGGGSCQLALTTDSPATKSSKWMVIHSIEGGCPSKSAAGNLGGSNGQGAGGGSPDAKSLADTYDFKIPNGIKPGQYTFAWSWFNKIGNREFYMNCASVKISGGAGKRDLSANETFAVPELAERDQNFPDLFIANMPATDCTTKEGFPVAFPNPGKSVDHFGDGKTAPPTGPKCGGGSGSGASAQTGGTGASAEAAAGAGSSTGASQAGAASSGASTPGQQGGSQVDTQAAPGQNAGSSSSNGAQAASPSSASPGSAPAAAANTPSGSTASQAPAAPQTAPAAAQAGSSCSKPGEVVCSPDKKQIGICDAQNKAAMQPVPQGTVCTASGISWPQKRSRIFRSSHVRRQHMIGGFSF